MRRKRAVILPVVLFVLVLIGLLAATFAFRVHADLAATQAMAYRMQTRLAAEAGVERVKQLLRTARFDRSVWYDNPDLFNRIIVSAHGREPRVSGTSEEFDEKMVYRFSIVADDPTDDKEFVRFGITDEASKLNLNTMTGSQLLKLVSGSVADNDRVDPQKIVDAIIDWRDADADPHGEDPGTEGDYYRALEKPYRVKNGPFDTIEELLLVKGVTPEILYGEDFDRNGLLSENERDGDRAFPPDNQDDVLNRGLFPYLTVLSAENNVSNDNRPRVYLLGEEAVVRAELEAAFPGEPAIVDYIVSAVKTPPAGGQQGGGQQGGGQQGAGQPPAGGGGQQPGTGGAGQPPAGGAGQQPGTGGAGQRPGTVGAGQPPAGGAGQQPGTGGAQGKPATGGGKLGPQQQRRDPPASGQPAGSVSPGGGPGKAPVPSAGGSGGTGGDGDVDPSTGAAGKGDGQQPPDAGAGGGKQEGGGHGAGGPAGSQQGSGDGGGSGTPIRTPASLMLPKTVDGQVVASPLTAAYLAVLMDRTTMIPPAQKTVPGLININTAPREVLQCIDELSAEQVEAILAKRSGLSAEVSSTTAWLVSEGVMDAAAFVKIAPHITARGQQFTIESVGYADHIGMVTRLQVVVDMNGPIAQTVYYRDISNLGGAYPIRKADKEKMRGR